MTSDNIIQPESLLLEPNEWVPNNAALPVLIYRNALQANDLTSGMETLFASNGYPPDWRDGIFDYHHYHSTAHEVLGIAKGSARVMLGGPGGSEVTMDAGDVLLLPVGTGHCRVEATNDFLVVGAYPAEQSWDACREAPSPAMRERMQHVPFPTRDPVNGDALPLTTWWKR